MLVGVGVWVGIPGIYTPMGCTLGRTAKGRLPGVPCRAGIIAGSSGPYGAIGVALLAMTVGRIAAVTTPENRALSIAARPVTNRITAIPMRIRIRMRIGRARFTSWLSGETSHCSLALYTRMGRIAIGFNKDN